MKKQAENLFEKSPIDEIVEILFGLLISMIIVSPLVGTVFAWMDWYWGGLAVVLTLLFSVLLTVLFYKTHVFRLNSCGEFFVFLILMIFGSWVYAQYSPVLKIEQDPGVYMFKALNLVNYGHIYKPMPVYSQLENIIGYAGEETQYAFFMNGAQYSNGVLHLDFYPGGTFFYALVGFFSKSRIFYGQTLVMLSNVGLLFFCLQKLTGKNKDALANGIYVIGFFITPVIVWFGRGSFSEPVAMNITLCILLLLLQEKQSTAILFVAFLMAATVRIDYLFIVLLGVFILTWINKKIGTIYTLVAIGEFVLLKNVYWIYSTRIFENDMPILQYGIAFLIIAYGVSLILSYEKVRTWILAIYGHKIIKILVFVFFFAITCLMFYSSVVSRQGKSVFELLFLVFPSIMLVGGIVGICRIVQIKDIPFCASVFVLGISVVYSYLFFQAGNSPQLYWFLRRYYNVILPVAALSFVYLMCVCKKNVYRLVGIGISVISVTLFFNSAQTVDYDGLDKSTIRLTDSFTKQGIETIFYDEDIRYKISPLVAFSDAEFIPYRGENLEKIYDFLVNEEADFNKIRFLTDKSVPAGATEGSISYGKMSEEIDMVPKTTYDLEDMFYICEWSEELLDDNILYPNSHVEKEGFYEQSEWSTSTIKIGLEERQRNKDKLIVAVYDYDNYYIKNDMFDELNIMLTINESQQIALQDFQDDNFIFDISEYAEDIETLTITMNTFVPEECGLGEDIRELGIPVRSIYFTDVKE